MLREGRGREQAGTWKNVAVAGGGRGGQSALVGCACSMPDGLRQAQVGLVRLIAGCTGWGDDWVWRVGRHDAVLRYKRWCYVQAAEWFWPRAFRRLQGTRCQVKSESLPQGRSLPTTHLQLHTGLFEGCIWIHMQS